MVDTTYAPEESPGRPLPTRTLADMKRKNKNANILTYYQFPLRKRGKMPA
jgi:hypothetical protein